MSQPYDWVEARIVESDERATVTFLYQAKGTDRTGNHRADEDVSGYTDEDIQRLARDVLDCDPKSVVVFWE